MCIIIVKKPGVACPSLDTLRQCQRVNKDGIGVMWHKSDSMGVHINKTFRDADQFHEWMKDNVSTEDTCVIHFRLATHGLTDVGNRHPFPITSDKSMLRAPTIVCNAALAHNGVIGHLARHEKFSDTQKFVMEILSNPAIRDSLDNPAVDRLVKNFIGSDKLAILDRRGELRLYGEYVDDNGLLFSNHTYKPFILEQTQSLYGEWPGWLDTCDVCGSSKSVRTVTQGKFVNTLLCAKCRKKHLRHDSPVKSEAKQCSNCFDWHERRELSQTRMGYMCKKCKADYDYLGY
jgi:hypothetical protein